MVGLTTDAAAVKGCAGISKTAGIVLYPSKTELFPFGGKYGIFALAVWGDSGCWLATECLICLVFEWKMVKATAAKTVRMLVFLGYL